MHSTGLVLYLVGVTHKLELGAAGLERRALGWVALGGFLPALCLGAALGGWLLRAGPGTRGTAPAPAFGGARRDRHPRAGRSRLLQRAGRLVGRGRDGEWVVTIRSAEIRDRTLRMFAGAGVVAGSDPEVELAETGAELRTMLHALGTTDAL